MKAVLEAVGVQLIFYRPIPQISQPIELFWSEVKNILKSVGARTYQAVKEALESAYAQVTLKNIRGWFTKDCYYTSSE